MNELKKHKAAILISAIILIAAIVAVAVIPSALRRAEISNQFDIAQQYLNDLDYESALLAFTRILEIDPKNVEARKALQDTYLAYIRSEWENGNVDHAKELMAEMREKLGLTEEPYTVTVTQEPTCGAEGLEEWDCVLNDDVLQRTIPATEAHAWGSGTITIPATCSDEGEITYPCTICESQKSEVLPMLIDEELIINDPNLEDALRAQINKPTGTLMVSDFAYMTHLELPMSDITDISGLVKLKNLVYIEFSSNDISDISPLSELVYLTELRLGQNLISDISPLADLTNLKTLNVLGNNISDISALASLTNLTDLNLGMNQISDLTPLTNLTNLTYLHLAVNNILDISPLAHLKNLSSLGLAYNEVSNIEPIAALPNLTYLAISHNSVSDISPLAFATNLTELDIDNTNITDISPLAYLSNLTEISLNINKVADISPIAHVSRINGDPNYYYFPNG